MSDNGFHIIYCLLWRRLKIKFLLASTRSLTNSENPSSNPVHETCSSFRKPPVNLKAVPKAACGSKIALKAGYGIFTGENRPITTKESRDRNFDVALGAIFGITKYF
jgi:hypothetical protein